MADPTHARLRRLFDRALDLPRAQRAAFLESQCGGDAELKARVEALLVAAEDERFLVSPTGSKPPAPADTAAESAAPLREGPGTRIGPYKLLQLIGEGGFGAVFMAEQEKPVARKVALKIIKLGMDTRQVVARFEQERQALALMDHPNIARVIDAGATETGRPYFVMDLVKGEPIVEYCDKHELTIDERLDLFAQVCAAVQHAHSKGIIHRDLKPSNILVATQDGRPQAKVIDFGIAKATSAKLTDKTLFTEHQQIIGTLQYMSPEQAEGSLDIDTRTDVYALGVLLYELLTGSTPFDKKTLGDAVFGEIRRMIREVDPPKPSTRLSDSHETLASIAAHRRVEPRRLGTILRGELDWIVMKALEKERARRYETANGLALDIRRYLSGEVVVAAPPGRAYRFSKFVRRNRVVVSAGGAVAAALLIGVIAFAWQAEVARDQRDLAVKSQIAEGEQRALARHEAEHAVNEAHTARRTSDFMIGLFQIVDPGEARGNTVTAREILDRGAKRIEAELREEPEVRASLMGTIGVVYMKLGLYPAALPLLREALEERRRTFGDEDVRVAESRNNLGEVLSETADYEGAERELRAALDVRRRLLGAHAATAESENDLASVLSGRGQWSEAEALARESLALRRKLLGRDAAVADSLETLAFTLLGQVKLSGQPDTAGVEGLLREALELRTELLGKHPSTASALSNLGTFLYERDRRDEAIRLFRESLDMKREVYGAVHPEVALGLNNLAFALHDQGDLEGAEKLYREAIELDRALLVDSHPGLAQALNNLAFVLNDRGDYEGARDCFVEALAVYRRGLGDEHASTLRSMLNLAGLLSSHGKPAEAEPYIREQLATRRRLFGDEDLEARNAMISLARCLLAQEKQAEVVTFLAPFEDKARKELARENAWWLARLLTKLGEARAGLAKNATEFAAAEAILLEANAIYANDAGKFRVDLPRECAQALVNFYGAWDKAEPDEGHDAKSAEWKATLEAMPQSVPRPGSGAKQ